MTAIVTAAVTATGTPRLGLGPNWRQFTLLVAINAFVGAMVGLERTVLPLLAEHEFGIASASAVLSFVAVFGLVKAFSNLAAGHLADRLGRKPLLVAGWLAALPVAPMIIWAPSWGWVVAANVFLGLNQGLAWSATVIMKIDLAGPERRGLAMGLNEAAGYGAVAVAAWATGALAVAHGPRPAPFLIGVGLSLCGLALSVGLVRETRGHAVAEADRDGNVAPALPFATIFARTTLRDPSLSAVSQAGLVNNLNDALAWGLVPLYLASKGLSVGRIGVVAAAYPAAWGLGQLVTGAWSDRVGRKPLIVGGMWLQAIGIAGVLVASAYSGWVVAALLMGAGTALTYPTLLAAVGDVAGPSWRASAVGVYRLWRDLGFVAGALVAGVVADLLGAPSAIVAVAVVTAGSGALVMVRMDETLAAPAASSAWRNA